MATAQQCHALTTYFIKKYTEVVGTAPVVNRNKSRWGFDSILMDYTPTQSREMIDYYLTHFERNDIEWFLFNYEKVDVRMREALEHEERAKRLRRETKKRVEEWRNRWQQTN